MSVKPSSIGRRTESLTVALVEMKHVREIRWSNVIQTFKNIKKSFELDAFLDG